MKSVNLLRPRLFGVSLALTALTVLSAFLASHDTAFAVTFAPEITVCFDDPSTPDPSPTNPGNPEECDGDNSPGASPDIRTHLVINAGDSNFGGLLSLTSSDWGVAKDADVTDGALVGQVIALAQLGFLSNPCKDVLAVAFDMLDATTNQTATTPFDDPNADTDGDNDDQFDVASDGLPLGATRYPDYLARTLVDEAGTTLQPISRLYGQTVVSGTDVSLNFLLFEPGAVFRTPTGDLVQTDLLLGYPSVTILQNIGDPQSDPEPGAITDFCSPLSTDTVLFGKSRDNPDTAANEAGAAFRTNPASAGGFNFVTYAVSQRDTDNDGHENGLDPCTFDADPTWDPRTPDAVQPGIDDDGDALTNGCDPEPAVPSQISGGTYDEDNDEYSNRQDNCPLDKNGLDTNKVLIGPNNQDDSDFDSIGDVCDADPQTPNGDRIALCLVAAVNIGAGGTPAANPQSLQPCDPNAQLTSPSDGAPTPTPTSGPGTGPGNRTGTDTGSDTGGPSTGVGSLAPAVSSVPTWAAIASGLGGAGLLGSLGAFLSRTFNIRRRRP